MSLTLRERKQWRVAWRTSSVLHLLVTALPLAWLMWLPLPSAELAGRSHRFHAPQATDEPVELIVDVATADEPSRQHALDFAPWLEIDPADSRWHEIVRQSVRPAPQRAIPPEGTTVWVAEELLRSVRQADAQSAEEKLAELQTLSQRLEVVSSAESVGDVSDTLGKLMGQTPRATAPVAAVPEGPFDFTSGQVHDVRKETDAAGNVTYIAIMLDSAGRTMEVELDAAAGEQAFRTMQIVKANPLLERVYRGVVMGLIDKMLEGK
jgi:hypothetical protein